MKDDNGTPRDARDEHAGPDGVAMSAASWLITATR